MPHPCIYREVFDKLTKFPVPPLSTAQENSPREPLSDCTDCGCGSQGWVVEETLPPSE